ncbi:MAG: hypothetical protein CMM67_03675 [Rhodospirillaceae bacterium]|nr:hypothetical protein [Rhodospirillaceae bacterium]OUT79952.1 MAG: hypothetical protein CBB83_03855 [Rhodospirillaceae bacterium TMED23]|tara:strand:- start:4338 stop:4880 length:543 start_codon:yes stop_codon:yes gene_type:complete
MNSSDFSRIIEVKDINAKEILKLDVSASNKELITLSNLFNVNKILSFTAQIILTQRLENNSIEMSCDFFASIIQECIISLELLNNKIQKKFRVDFIEQKFYTKPLIDKFDCFEDEQPEIISNGRIDIGPVLVQNLGLEIDPFPKIKGISLNSIYKQDDLTTEEEIKPSSLKILLKDYKFK